MAINNVSWSNGDLVSSTKLDQMVEDENNSVDDIHIQYNYSDFDNNVYAQEVDADGGSYTYEEVAISDKGGNFSYKTRRKSTTYSPSAVIPSLIKRFSIRNLGDKILNWSVRAKTNDKSKYNGFKVIFTPLAGSAESVIKKERSDFDADDSYKTFSSTYDMDNVTVGSALNINIVAFQTTSSATTNYIHIEEIKFWLT